MKKSETINQAYAKLRISGLTVEPTPEDIQIALYELDNMMLMWAGMGIDINYNMPMPTVNDTRVESNPDDMINVEPFAYSGIIASLALRMAPFFGAEEPQRLVREARSGLNVIRQHTFRDVTVQYPNRMPLGSGNTLRGAYWNRFHYPAYKTRSNYTNIKIGAVSDFVADFTTLISKDDEIASYTISATPELEIIADEQNGNLITYQMRGVREGVASVSITVTALDGIVIREVINYEVVSDANSTPRNSYS